MVDILDINPFPCGIKDEELEPPDIYGGGGDLFLILLQGDGPAPYGDDDEIFSVDDIDDMPLGDDDDEMPVPDSAEDFDIDNMPLGDEEKEPEQLPAEEIPAEEPGPQDPAMEEPELEKAQGGDDDDEQSIPMPERIQIPEPDPRQPWIEQTRAQYDAIRRAREDIELVAQREIDEIVNDLEGGGINSFGRFMDRLKAGEYAHPARVKKYLTFYFMMNFATLDYKALFQDHDLTICLWRDYGRYIPPACWREYVEKTDSDHSILICAETFFKFIRDKYLHHMRDELAKREAAWEAAAMAATAAEDYAHKTVESTGRLTQGAADVSRAVREKAKALEERTAYGWRKAMWRYAYLLYPTLMDLDVDGMRTEYAAVCNEFFEKLNEYRKESTK